MHPDDDGLPPEAPALAAAAPTLPLREIHPNAAALLRYFECGHLPPPLQKVAEPFHELAILCARTLDGAELTAGLRKLLEAKDCMVRAALP